MDRVSEQFSGLGFGDCSLCQGTEAQALETHRSFTGHRPWLLVRCPAPAATGKFAEEQSKQYILKDSEVLAAVSESLDAHAENPLEIEEFAPAHGLAVLTNFRPERFSRHKKGTGEAVGSLFVVNLRCDVEDHVAEFMRDCEALALACASRIPNSFAESRIEATLRGA